MKKIKFKNKKLVVGVAGVVAILLVGFLLTRGSGAAQQLIPVVSGSIVEVVSVTGNTSPVESVSLGFGNSGTVSRVYASVGTTVRKGQVLAELNTSDLYAQVKQAEANLDAQQAKLDGLKSGSRPEDIAASQAAYDKAQQDLTNMYASIRDTLADSYAKANDAIRVQISEIFSNAESNTPQINYVTSNTQEKNLAEAQRVTASASLNTWQTKLGSGAQSSAALDASLQESVEHLDVLRRLLDNVSKTLDGASGLDATTLASYKASVTTAITAVNTASKNLNTAAQNISSQKLTVAQAEAQLNLKKAGTSVEDVKAQEAQVKSAEASVESARAKITNSQLISPIAGVVTQFDAKVGQTASPGTALVSIISKDAFEVETLVSEIDVGKITVGNAVTMTLDAFPNEEFAGSVYFIDPAQTTNEGVVGYKVKISFTATDTRMKSGLTANLDIETRRKDGVLIVPQYAILQNDEGTFVEVMEQGVVTRVPVTLGLQDQTGNVEIVSGLSEEQQVRNIGLKQK